MRVASGLVLTDEEHALLTKLSRSKLSSVRLAQRARRVLLAAQSLLNKEIAAQLGVGRVQVSRWRERYTRLRLATTSATVRPRYSRRSACWTGRSLPSASRATATPNG